MARGRRIVGVLGALWCVALLVVFATRVTFPLELEWMEGGILHHALRIQRGELLYPPPSPDFVPFLYTPLYPIVLALLGTALPLDFELARFVSIAAVLALGVGVARAVAREGKGPQEQWMAVGLLASGYVFTFRWLDVGRPDAMTMALLVWGLVFLREAWGDHRKAAVAGVLMAAAFWTKQTAALVIVASAVGALLVAPRQLWSYALVIAVIDGGGVAWANAQTDGWLWHYIYELHQQHAFNEERFWVKTWGMFLHAWPWLIPVLGAILVDFFAPWVGSRRRLDAEDDARWDQYLRGRRGLGFWAVLALAGLLVSALGYSTQWAEPNAFLPGVVFLAIFIGVGMPARGIAALVGFGGVALQLVFHACIEPQYQPIQDRGWAGIGESYRFDPWSRSIPSAEERTRAAETRRTLEGASGPVFALQRPWWSVIAGGSGHVGSMGLHDVEPRARRALERALVQRLRTHRVAQVWLEGEPPAWLLPGLLGYHVVERRSGRARVRPLTGYMSEAGMVTPYREPQLRLGPVEPRLVSEGARVFFDFEDGTAQGFTLQGGWERGPVRPMTSTAPALGPAGGEYVLSSAATGGLAARGAARSPVYGLPDSGLLSLWVGVGPHADGLAVMMEHAETRERVAIPLPDVAYRLTPIEWSPPPAWAGAPVRVVLEDRSPKNALFVDDGGWIMRPGRQPPP